MNKISKLKNAEIIKKIETSYLRTNLPILKIGDKVKLGVKIEEGGKIRTQAYQGTIISKQNTTINQTIIVRKVMEGIGIERSFLIHSPKIDFIKIEQSSKIRRSKLYYLRKLYGKSARLKQL